MHCGVTSVSKSDQAAVTRKQGLNEEIVRAPVVSRRRGRLHIDFLLVICLTVKNGYVCFHADSSHVDAHTSNWPHGTDLENLS
jgi:hypothetical protein